jgi:hypothetical protein
MSSRICCLHRYANWSLLEPFQSSGSLWSTTAAGLKPTEYPQCSWNWFILNAMIAAVCRAAGRMQSAGASSRGCIQSSMRIRASLFHLQQLTSRKIACCTTREFRRLAWLPWTSSAPFDQMGQGQTTPACVSSSSERPGRIFPSRCRLIRLFSITQIHLIISWISPFTWE